MNDVIKYYDALIDENNDPVHDPKPLRDYMDKWDGQAFIDEMQLDMSKSVLEIGMGTGRLAVRIAPLCSHFVGIDISPKTIKRAKENLKDQENNTLVCDDFFAHDFEGQKYDVIYSSLTFMHIKDKRSAINKIASMLSEKGRFVLSIDKKQSNVIGTGTSKIKIYPDDPNDIEQYISSAGLVITNKIETEFAFIFTTEE